MKKKPANILSPDKPELTSDNGSDNVKVKVRFITLMQQYSGQKEIEMKLPPDPANAIDTIIRKFHIPWENNLEKSARIFINKEILSSFTKSGKRLHTNDVIAFIPISGGG